ncbi:MAG TPA: fatty acid desaturase [Bryobacteraceae bacterium]|jgi:omega-6 fatty acid desaturase (delta-12 desaturase)
MSPLDPDASDLAVRAVLEKWRGSDNRLAGFHFAVDSILYIVCILAAELAPGWPWRIAAGIAAGVITLRLASIAHDACHRSYTTSHNWNRFIGRVAFLPALQPRGTWEMAHNIIHHSWTSVKDKDYVWIPLSKEDYDAATPGQRLLERIYRSPWGHGLYYAIELWWRRVVVPSFRWSEIPRRSQRFDILLTGAFLLVWIGTVAGICAFTSRSIPLGLLCGVILPAATWFWLFGFVLYVQHTHPEARFFKERREQDFYFRQLASATHVVFPAGLNRFLHGIFEHTAHHLDVTVPFYRLEEAQSELESLAGDRIVIERWSLRGFFHTARVCKLYDYNQHCWLDFQGRKSGT